MPHDPHSFHALRLRPSSWALAVVVLCGGLVVNCGGDFRYEADMFGKNPVKYGWPWFFAQWRTTGDGEPIPWTAWWRIDQATDWQVGLLVANVLTFVVLAGAAAWLAEQRLRRSGRWYHISMREILILVAVAAFLCHYGLGLYQDRREEAELVAAIGTDSNLYYDTYPREVPADWFWHTFHVPPAYQPTIRTHVRLRADKEEWIPTPCPPPVIGSLGRARGLEHLFLNNLIFPPEALRGASWPKVDRLVVDFNTHEPSAWNDEHFRALPTLPNLETLCIKGGSYSDSGLAALLSQTSLRSLGIQYAPESFRGHELDRLTQLETLSLTNVHFDDQTLTQLGRLTNLRSLALQDHNGLSRTTGQGWEVLASLQKLESLTLHFHHDRGDAAEFGDAGLAALARLPQLRKLELQYHSRITDAGLAHLVKYPCLEELTICFNRHGTIRVTDAGIEHLTALAKRGRMKTMRIEFPNAGYDAYRRLSNAFPNLSSFDWQFLQEKKSLGIQDED